ncbi:murein L,D-transpeptidase catalytic domain family protein [Bdellovibrio svalbardensis]|uniref:Murein L,D-transpeptidase catalytic domain family protein n=1 Tax=Bdellovibrio svalbardensis TaxID=2972972 RepID=A0ABT6DJ26_9BACT|nr:murein L,D-transpeptidase catalytic domain family protein [Bdellovibrio svalbardensis]MDG0816793.1 murein L,D-transpeptidase catalytic domain family protein [Bdellovibrio svalbardensis]
MKPQKLNQTFKNIFCVSLFTLALAACAPGGMETSATKLADDPQNEPVSTGDGSSSNTGQAVVTPPVTPPASGNSGTTDLPSTSGSGSTSGSTSLAAKYSYVDPTKIVPAGQLKSALAYYDANAAKIKNKDYLSVIDFRQFSGKKRFFIINMKTGEVWAIRVAHGKGSDPDHDGYANSFSNASGSNASSLGYYLAAETYDGSHGYSLKLDGLSSTNSNARSRSVVVHGADYVSEASVIQGRSWGCPAVAMENRTKLINMIKGGSLIYASATEN